VEVRKYDQRLLKAIDRILIDRKPDIERMLASYRVPIVKN